MVRSYNLRSETLPDPTGLAPLAEIGKEVVGFFRMKYTRECQEQIRPYTKAWQIKTRIARHAMVLMF